MKKSLKWKKSSAPREPKADIAGIISGLQQQLAVMDRKLDTLISRSSERPPEARRFSNPYQRADEPRSQSQSQHQHQSQRPPEMKKDNAFRERVLHKAICADCNKPCEVPFKPSQDRPVYCKECFAKRRNVGGSGGAPKAAPVPAPVQHTHSKPEVARKPAKKKPAARRRK